MKEQTTSRNTVLEIDHFGEVGILTPRNPDASECAMSIWNPYSHIISAEDIDHGLGKIVDEATYEKWLAIFEKEKEVTKWAQSSITQDEK